MKFTRKSSARCMYKVSCASRCKSWVSSFSCLLRELNGILRVRTTKTPLSVGAPINLVKKYSAIWRFGDILAKRDCRGQAWYCSSTKTQYVYLARNTPLLHTLHLKKKKKKEGGEGVERNE